MGQYGRESRGLESAHGRGEAHRVRCGAAHVQSVKRGERRDRESGLRVRTLRDLLRQQRCAKVAPKDAHRRRCYKGDTRDGVRQVRQAARVFARVVEGKQFPTPEPDAHAGPAYVLICFKFYHCFLRIQSFDPDFENIYY